MYVCMYVCARVCVGGQYYSIFTIMSSSSSSISRVLVIQISIIEVGKESVLAPLCRDPWQ